MNRVPTGYLDVVDLAVVTPRHFGDFFLTLGFDDAFLRSSDEGSPAPRLLDNNASRIDALPPPESKFSPDFE